VGPLGAATDNTGVLALEGFVGWEPHRGDAELTVLGTRKHERHARAVRVCAGRGRVRRAPSPDGTLVTGPRLARPREKDDRDPIVACVTASGATGANGGAPGFQQVTGRGSPLRIRFGLSECPGWLWRESEETGDPGCTVQRTEEPEEVLEGLAELLWILSEPTPAEERAATGAGTIATGDPGATGPATAWLDSGDCTRRDGAWLYFWAPARGPLRSQQRRT